MFTMKIEHDGEEFLFNGRAYILTNNSPEKLLELEKELKTISPEYLTFFQLEAMYNFHKDRGLRSNTLAFVERLEVGDFCIIRTDMADAKITKLSKSFCCIEWGIF